MRDKIRHFEVNSVSLLPHTEKVKTLDKTRPCIGRTEASKWKISASNWSEIMVPWLALRTAAFPDCQPEPLPGGKGQGRALPDQPQESVVRTFNS